MLKRTLPNVTRTLGKVRYDFLLILIYVGNGGVLVVGNYFSL